MVSKKNRKTAKPKSALAKAEGYKQGQEDIIKELKEKQGIDYNDFSNEESSIDFDDYKMATNKKLVMVTATITIMGKMDYINDYLANIRKSKRANNGLIISINEEGYEYISDEIFEKYYNESE